MTSLRIVVKPKYGNFFITLVDILRCNKEKMHLSAMITNYIYNIYQYKYL